MHELPGGNASNCSFTIPPGTVGASTAKFSLSKKQLELSNFVKFGHLDIDIESFADIKVPWRGPASGNDEQVLLEGLVSPEIITNLSIS